MVVLSLTGLELVEELVVQSAHAEVVVAVVGSTFLVVVVVLDQSAQESATAAVARAATAKPVAAFILTVGDEFGERGKLGRGVVEFVVKEWTVCDKPKS